MQRDPETGIEYQEIEFPRYKIGTQVIYPHHAKYQKPFDIELGGQRVHTQLILWTITGCTFSPDSKMEWRYFIKSPLTAAAQGDAVFEKDLIPYAEQ